MVMFQNKNNKSKLENSKQIQIMQEQLNLFTIDYVKNKNILEKVIFDTSFKS